MSSTSESNLIDSSGFRDPELDKPKKTFTEEKPIFASVQLKSSTFRDPELDKPKKTNDEDKPAFSVQLKGSGSAFRDPELDKHQHRKVSSEEPKPLIQLKNFRDPELDKPKKSFTDDKPAFASVSLRSSAFKDPELEKSKRASVGPSDLPPAFAAVQLRSGSSEARSPSSARKSFATSDPESRKSFVEEKPAFSVALKKTEVAPADLRGDSPNIQKSPTLESKGAESNPAFTIKLKSVSSDFKDPEIAKKEQQHPLEKRNSFYDTVVALKKTRNAPADLRGDSPNIHKSPTAGEEEKKKDEVPVFVGVKLRSISDKLKASKQEEAAAAPSPIYELPRKSFASPDTAGQPEPEAEAEAEADKPVFASVDLKKVETNKLETDASEGAVASPKPQEKKERMSFYDAAVALRKTETTPHGDPLPSSRSPPPQDAPLPEFVGFKLKKLGEQAKERTEEKEQRKSLSFTRRMNSIENFKYLEEPPAPSVTSPPPERKSLTKSQSFTKRSTEAEWEKKYNAVNN